MLKVRYYVRKKTFSMKWGRLDENDWKNSYELLLQQSEWACRHSKAFSSKIDQVKFQSSDLIEIEYLIYHGFATKQRWTYDYLPKGIAYDKMSDMCKLALGSLTSVIKGLIDNINRTDYHPYSKKAGDTRKYYKLDNFNRFVFRLDKTYNIVSISSIMFHHNDKIVEAGSVEKWMKKLLKQIVNDYLADIDNLKSDKFKEFVDNIRSNN